MSYKGKYYPSFPRKYKGDPTNIVYRSLWERKFMVYCDKNQNILEWASEEIAIPYRSPIDNRVHRYFPDFYMKVKETNGKIKITSSKLNLQNKLYLQKNQKDKLKDIFVKHMNTQRTKQNGKWQESSVLTVSGSLK